MARKRRKQKKSLQKRIKSLILFFKKYILPSFLFLLKLIFYYPFCFFRYLSRKIASSVRTHKKVKKQVQENTLRPQQKPIPDPFVEVATQQGDVTKFEKKLYTNKSSIGIILGARGTGKSAIGMRMLENFASKTKKHIYAMGFDTSSLPEWIQSVEKIEDISNDGVILIDEGGITFSSRKSMSQANTILSDLLLISRHKDLSVIFISQNSANLEINAIRQTDYLILKPSSLLQKDFERKKIKDIYEEVDFKDHLDIVGITYIYSDQFRGYVSNSLPTFWSEKVSKGFAHRK